ncbi:hypothetical protein WME89_26585 [Sorangium sp. So ce321]
MDKSAFARGADGLLVQMLRFVPFAADARDLGADQRRAIAEVFRAARSPGLDLPVMGDERREVLRPLVGEWRCRVVARRQRERTVEMVFGECEEHRRRPEEPLRLRPGLEGRGVITRVATRLQLVEPVPARGDREARIALEAPLEPGPRASLPSIRSTTLSVNPFSRIFATSHRKASARSSNSISRSSCSAGRNWIAKNGLPAVFS